MQIVSIYYRDSDGRVQFHPVCVSRISTGEFELHGWVYNIETGGVTAYEAKADSFLTTISLQSRSVTLPYSG